MSSLSRAVIDNIEGSSVYGWLTTSITGTSINVLENILSLTLGGVANLHTGFKISESGQPFIYRFSIYTLLSFGDLLNTVLDEDKGLVFIIGSSSLRAEIWRPIQIFQMLMSLNGSENARFQTLASSFQLPISLEQVASQVFVNPVGRDGAHGSSKVCLAKTMPSISEDCSAIAGANGHLFLYRGTNNLERQYSMNADCVAKTATQWEAIFEQRASKIKDYGSIYYQLIIPEKSSILPEYRTYQCGTAITPSLKLLNRILHNKNYYINVYDLIASSPYRFFTYAQTDTHFTSLGAGSLTASLLQNMFELDAKIEPINFVENEFTGDLSKPGPFIGQSEILAFYANVCVNNKLLDDPILISSSDPLSGSHIGIRRHWQTRSPLVCSKVLIFGNSFFERGGTSRTLSWWFSRIFKECLFLWSSDLKIAEVEAFNPDIVLCQTVERFLPAVPKA